MSPSDKLSFVEKTYNFSEFGKRTFDIKTLLENSFTSCNIMLSEYMYIRLSVFRRVKFVVQS